MAQQWTCGLNSARFEGDVLWFKYRGTVDTREAEWALQVIGEAVAQNRIFLVADVEGANALTGFRQTLGKGLNGVVDRMLGQVFLRAGVAQKIVSKALTVVSALSVKSATPQLFTDSDDEARAWIEEHRNAAALTAPRHHAGLSAGVPVAGDGDTQEEQRNIDLVMQSMTRPSQAPLARSEDEARAVH